MGRPRIPTGTHGEIRCKQVRERTKDQPALWVARTRFRMPTGKFRRLKRSGETDGAAKANLRAEVARLSKEASSRKVSGDTRMAKIIDGWLADERRRVKLGKLSPKTLGDYESRCRVWIRPAIEELIADEVTADVVDQLVKDVEDKTSTATAKSVKVVLRRLCAYGIRRGAFETNPVDALDRLVAGGGLANDIDVMSVEQIGDLHASLVVYAATRAEKGDARGRQLGPRADVYTQLPDMMSCQLSTASRIGEVLAITPEKVDLKNRTVTLDQRIARVKGEGLKIVPGRKGGRPPVTVTVPKWSMPIWRRLVLAAEPGQLLFRTWDGDGIPDPDNVRKRIRAACRSVGYGWVTSHVWRKTTATALGDAGVPSAAIADQLGNTVNIAEKHYRRKQRVVNADLADHLEPLGQGIKEAAR